MVRMIATKTSKTNTGFIVIAHVPLLPANTYIHTIDQEGGCVFLHCTDEEMGSEQWRDLLYSVTKSFLLGISDSCINHLTQCRCLYVLDT